MPILIFIFGVIIGSFLNVCIYRIPRKQAVSFPGSHCPSCTAALRARDLVPVASYLLYRGKCRYCKSQISAQYPAVELLNGVLWLILSLRHGGGTDLFFGALLTSILIAVSFIDYYHYIIPNRLVIITIILALLLSLIPDTGVSHLSRLFGFLLGGGGFLLIAMLSKGAMGGGDIKLMAALGLYFGWQGILALMLLAFGLGAIISVVLLAKGIKRRSDSIPFGPFISLAAYIILLYGDRIIYFYRNSF